MSAMRWAQRRVRVSWERRGVVWGVVVREREWVRKGVVRERMCEGGVAGKLAVISASERVKQKSLRMVMVSSSAWEWIGVGDPGEDMP